MVLVKMSDDQRRKNLTLLMLNRLDTFLSRNIPRHEDDSDEDDVIDVAILKSKLSIIRYILVDWKSLRTYYYEIIDKYHSFYYPFYNLKEMATAAGNEKEATFKDLRDILM